jgi:hypothetical protein
MLARPRTRGAWIRYDRRVRVGCIALACALAGCGRIGFEARSDTGGPVGDGQGSETGDGTMAATDGRMPPPNDLCANAIDVTAGGTWMGTTCGANDEYTNTCFTAGAPDVWYVVTRGSGGGIINFFIAVDQGFVTKTGTGMCGDSTLTNCRITQIASQANMTFPIVVEREDGDCGSYTLQITIM